MISTELPFLVVCLNCKDYQLTTLQFLKPRKIRMICYKCGFVVDINYDPKTAQPSTKKEIEKYRKIKNKYEGESN